MLDVSKFHQLEHLLDQLFNFQDSLSEYMHTISPDQWQCFDYNLCQFGKVPFTSLCHYYSDIFKEVVLVLNNNTFDWL
jgi:hypothetical protein